MAVYQVVGNKLVSEQEIAFRGNSEKFGLERGLAKPSLRADGTAFTAIGPGLPLTVEILHLYTGKYPQTIFGSAPMLLTSAISNIDDSGASAEAVNFLLDKVGKNSDFNAPPADKKGTPLVCYVPAVTAVSTTITFNLVFEIFPDAAFAQIQSLFGGAGSIPLFLSASPYLVGAGFVLKLAQNIGDAIFNGKPNFNPTFTINFSGIGPVSQAGYLALFSQKDDPSTAPSSLIFDPAQGLVNPASGASYSGNAPYAIVGIDGADRPSFANFTPLAASSTLLAQFFNVQDGGTIPISDVLNVLKTVNDVSYRQKAENVQKAIGSPLTDPTELPLLQQQLKAYLANIQDPDLKPSGA